MASHQGPSSLGRLVQIHHHAMRL